MNLRPWTLGTRRHFLALCAALPAPWAAASAVTHLPPPMLARDGDPGIDPTGWLVSEKLDGVRARWDGQTLWFRSGHPVAAPDWFLAGLPRGVAIDGELWMGRGTFERLSACVRRPCWHSNPRQAQVPSGRSSSSGSSRRRRPCGTGWRRWWPAVAKG